jgi:hypothetical protein
MSKVENQLFSLVRELRGGYVHNPRDIFCVVSEEKPHKCSAVYWAYYNDMREYADDMRCKVQCEECKRICHENDYIRGLIHKDKGHYPVPAIQTKVRFGPRHIDISVLRHKKEYWSENWWPYWLCVRLWTN